MQQTQLKRELTSPENARIDASQYPRGAEKFSLTTRRGTYSSICPGRSHCERDFGSRSSWQRFGRDLFLLLPRTLGLTIEPLTREHRAAALGRAAVALLYPCPGGRGRR